MNRPADSFMARLRRPNGEPERIVQQDIEESFQDIAEPDNAKRQLQALADRLATEVAARVDELRQPPTAYPIDRLEALARHFAEISFADMLEFTGAVVAKLPPPGPSAFDLSVALRDWAREAEVRKVL